MIGERRCIVAPNKHHYVYCPSCGKGDIKESWRFLYCSDNCREIYKVCEDFVNERIDGKQANDRLKSLDLSDIADFHPNLQANIADIYASLETEMSALTPAPVSKETKTEEEDTKKKKIKL